MRMIIAALVFAFGISGEAKAGYFYDGNSLYEKCSGSSNYDQGACTAYIAGAQDLLNFWNDGGKIKFVCMPGEARAGQISDVVKKWLNDNPSQRHFPAAMLISKALIEVFPCPKE
jgi:hypothetical protein